MVTQQVSDEILLFIKKYMYIFYIFPRQLSIVLSAISIICNLICCSLFFIALSVFSMKLSLDNAI